MVTHFPALELLLHSLVQNVFLNAAALNLADPSSMIKTINSSYMLRYMSFKCIITTTAAKNNLLQSTFIILYTV